jgi:hypothetical protein
MIRIVLLLATFAAPASALPTVNLCHLCNCCRAHVVARLVRPAAGEARK